MTKDYLGNKKISCYNCGYESTKKYNFTKQKWVRKFKCPICKSESFKYHNF